MNCSQVGTSVADYQNHSARRGGASPAGTGWSDELDKYWQRTKAAAPETDQTRLGRRPAQQGGQAWTPGEQQVKGRRSDRAESGTGESRRSRTDEGGRGAKNERTYSQISLRDPWPEDHPLREKCDAFLEMFRETYGAVLEERGLMPQDGQYDPLVLPDDELADIKNQMIDRLENDPEAMELMRELYVDLAGTGQAEERKAEEAVQETEEASNSLKQAFQNQWRGPIADQNELLVAFAFGMPLLLHVHDEAYSERETLSKKMMSTLNQVLAEKGLTSMEQVRDPETGEMTEEARAAVEEMYQRLKNDPAASSLMDKFGMTARSESGWPVTPQGAENEIQWKLILAENGLPERPSYSAEASDSSEESEAVSFRPWWSEVRFGSQLSEDMYLARQMTRHRSAWICPDPNLSLEERTDTDAFDKKLFDTQMAVMKEMGLTESSQFKDPRTGELNETGKKAVETIYQRLIDDPDTKALMDKLNITGRNEDGWPQWEREKIVRAGEGVPASEFAEDAKAVQNATTAAAAQDEAKAEETKTEEVAASVLGETIPMTDVRHGRRMIILGVAQCLLLPREKPPTIYDEEYLTMVKKAQAEVLREYGIDPETYGDPEMMKDPAYVAKLEKALPNMSRRIYEKISADSRGRALMNKLEIRVPPSVQRQWEEARQAEEAALAANPQDAGEEGLSDMVSRLTRGMLKKFLENFLAGEEADNKGFSQLLEDEA